MARRGAAGVRRREPDPARGDRMVSGGRLLGWVLRIGLAGVYLYAAIPKILEPWEFARSIWNFRLLPQPMIPPLALWLPPLEAVAALAVLFGVLYRGGLVVLAGLSAAFAAGVGSAIARGLDIDCGCFGKAASSEANLPHLLFNVALLAAAVVLLILHARSARTPRSRA
ncbi:MAG: DoxX family protein [Candidatus Eisenbacteria bacterium]|nr:DoxX family protein [Candidatus Latescibacterota bacterium]MBD3302435.1 DoxX family protein [Candidatus Eisenbacteria bacterium]